MTRRGERANLRDIAEAAGVSMQTASRVVRGVDVVAESTRVRVLAAIEELNYQPNMAARSLSARRTGSIHIIDAVPLLHGHATTYVVICQQLAALGLHISTSVIRSELDGLALRELVPVGADGVIILGGRYEPGEWVRVVASRLPTVYVGQLNDLPEHVVGVAVDHRMGARMAVEHLVSRGASNVAHVEGPTEWVDARLRYEGCIAACAAANLEPLVLPAGSWDAAAAAPLMSRLDGSVDAIFAANDHLALGCMTSLQMAGRRVPGDVKVVGFDDALGAEWFLPPLTTVRQDFRAVGEAAVAALNLLLNGDPAESTVITPTLVVRSST
ncbi:LacI family DNA-binding transcriptional regulator [Tessaracoccus sp. G1721]